MPWIELPPVHVDDVVADFFAQLFFGTGGHGFQLLDKPAQLGCIFRQPLRTKDHHGKDCQDDQF